MKQLILLLLLNFAAFQVQAQPGPGFKEGMAAGGERFAKIKEAREAFIAEQLALTPQQAAAFFPVFWSYEAKLRDNMPPRGRANAGAAPTASLTEAEALAQLRAQRERRQYLLDLKAKAEEDFLKIIPATKVIRLPEVEKAFRQRLWERAREGRERRRN